LELVEVAAFSEQELEAYHIQIDKARIEATVLEDAKVEGKAEGEAAAKAEIVRAMRASGLGVSQIAQFTGLSAQQINDLLGQ
jgi:predicted transposase/invertase (TIGR01784 family)